MFTPYYTAGTGANYHNFTPYYTQYTQNNQSQTLYGIHYPQMLQYSYLPQHQYGYGFSANSVSATNTGKIFVIYYNIGKIYLVGGTNMS